LVKYDERSQTNEEQFFLFKSAKPGIINLAGAKVTADKFTRLPHQKCKLGFLACIFIISIVTDKQVPLSSMQYITVNSDIFHVHCTQPWHYLPNPNSKIVTLNPILRIQNGGGTEFSCLKWAKNLKSINLKTRNIISYLRVILARTSKINQQSGKILNPGSTVLDSKMFSCRLGMTSHARHKEVRG